MLKPIHVEFLEAPLVLNDNESENKLHIGVFNPSLPSVDGQTAAADLVLKVNVPLYFWFITDNRAENTQAARPWGLTTKARLKGANVQIVISPNQGDWSTDFHSAVAQRPDLMGYLLKPKKDIVLKPGEHLSLTIKGIVTDLVSGPTMAFFSYKSDTVEHHATFGPVQKTPFTSQAQEAGLGILPTTDTSLRIKQKRRSLHIAPATELKKHNHVLDLIKFGKDGDYQILHKSSGHFGKPTIGINTDQADAIGFYTNGSAPLLEVEGKTGNTWIKGNLTVKNALTLKADSYIENHAWLEWGKNVTKQQDAGKIAYARWSDGLDIVGAGTAPNNRKIKLWAEGGLTVSGDMEVNGKLSVSGNVDSIIKVVVIRDQQIGGQKCGYPNTTWSKRVDYGVAFSETPQVYAVLQGFSAYPKEDTSDPFREDERGAEIGSAWVRVTSATINHAHIQGFVGEFDSSNDNSLLFTLVAIGQV